MHNAHHLQKPMLALRVRASGREGAPRSRKSGLYSRLRSHVLVPAHHCRVFIGLQMTCVRAARDEPILPRMKRSLSTKTEEFSSLNKVKRSCSRKRTEAFVQFARFLNCTANGIQGTDRSRWRFWKNRAIGQRILRGRSNTRISKRFT